MEEMERDARRGGILETLPKSERKRLIIASTGSGRRRPSAPRWLPRRSFSESGHRFGGEEAIEEGEERQERQRREGDDDGAVARHRTSNTAFQNMAFASDLRFTSRTTRTP